MNNDKQKESSLLIQLGDKIDVPELKREYLLKLKDVISDEPNTLISQPYKLQNIFQKFNKPILQKFKQKTKKQIIHLKQVLLQKQSFPSFDKEINPIEPEIQEETTTKSLNLIGRITYQKWNINIIITIQDSFKLQIIALVDSGAQINCIQEELIPTIFFEKTEQKLSTANGENLRVKFKISDVNIYNRGIYIKQLFILVKDNLDRGIILGQPFLEVIKPFKVTNEGITTKLFQQKILFTFNKKPITKEINLLKTLFIFKEHSINLIRTKEKHLSFMTSKKLEQQLLALQIHNKKLIRSSKSPLRYAAFYSKPPRLLINYKPLDIVRHPIQNNKDLLKKFTTSRIILRLDLRSGFWHKQIQNNNKYKIISFDTPSKIMNNIFIQYSSFLIMNIDDILTFLKEQHFKYLYIFYKMIQTNDLVLSKTKLDLFITHVRFLGTITCSQFPTKMKTLSVQKSFTEKLLFNNSNHTHPNPYKRDSFHIHPIPFKNSSFLTFIEKSETMETLSFDRASPTKICRGRCPL
ncbi:hypothetical protein CFOL_v3_15367 [Cephalotus follicularis]|uniref:Retropepsins domain-containing protein n=1 Tax=Cephalotus follicularis TaxID=3775 RepID=A0A1Q3BVM0_CEPFO|nr:hypothetical protein CFOL_v3_15367 [Cephalotus follicularis]